MKSNTFILLICFMAVFANMQVWILSTSTFLMRMLTLTLSTMIIMVCGCYLYSERDMKP